MRKLVSTFFQPFNLILAAFKLVSLNPGSRNVISATKGISHFGYQSDQPFWDIAQVTY